MPLGLLFWILVVIYLVLWGFTLWGYVPGPYGPAGGNLLVVILIIILGWQVFGSMIK